VRRQGWLAAVYDAACPIWLEPSAAICQAPAVGPVGWEYAMPKTVLKRVARARSGALATGARRSKMGFTDGDTCPCCGQEPEDDLHPLTGCEATGAADCELNRLAAWRAASKEIRVEVKVPKQEWLQPPLGYGPRPGGTTSRREGFDRPRIAARQEGACRDGHAVGGGPPPPVRTGGTRTEARA